MTTPIRQLDSLTSYTADGTTTVWDFSFSGGYLDQSHVKAYYITPAGARTELTITPAMFIGPYQLSITPPVVSGDELTIYRSTPTDALMVDFADRAAFTEVSVDTAVKQALFAAAETADALSVATERLSSVATYAQLAVDSSNAAIASAAAASTSATDAATSATNAQNSANAAAATAASFNDANIVHKAGAETITGVKTFSAQPVGITAASVGLGNVNNTSDANKPVSTAQQVALDLRSMRNRIINGAFVVNQRGITSASASYGAGTYVLDRWKAGATGATLSWAQSGIDVIVTLTAGTLVQVIEDINVEGGTYVLSHNGTAQARVAANGAALSGAFAAASKATPLVTAAATARQTITVELSTGTIDKVQLEPADSTNKASSFERRSYSLELYLCQRYYAMLGSSVYGSDSTGVARCHWWLPVTMRTTPTVVNQGTAGNIFGSPNLVAKDGSSPGAQAGFNSGTTASSEL